MSCWPVQTCQPGVLGGTLQIERMLTADVGIYSISSLPGCPMSSSSSSSSCWLCYCVFLALSRWGRGTGELLRQVKSHTASPYIIMHPIHQSCRLDILSSWSHDLFVFFLPHAPPQMCMGQIFVTKSSFHLFFCLHTIFFLIYHSALWYLVLLPPPLSCSACDTSPGPLTIWGKEVNV